MTQKKIVLDHLRKRGSITAFEAIMDHNIFRLSARIFELIADGHKIEAEWRVNETTKKHYVRYHLREVA